MKHLIMLLTFTLTGCAGNWSNEAQDIYDEINESDKMFVANCYDSAGLYSWAMEYGRHEARSTGISRCRQQSPNPGSCYCNLIHDKYAPGAIR